MGSILSQGANYPPSPNDKIFCYEQIVPISEQEEQNIDLQIGATFLERGYMIINIKNDQFNDQKKIF